MDETTNIPWQLSGGARYGSSSYAAAPSYLTADQAARYSRLRLLHQLYCDEHFEYFISGGRTQFQFTPIDIDGRIVKMFVPFNLLRLISIKSADLLFGEEPLVKLDDDTLEKSFRDMADRSHLHQRLLDAAIECSWAGEAMLELLRWQGQVYVQNVEIGTIHPEGPLQPDGQYASYVRYEEAVVGEGKNAVSMVLVTRYVAGAIERSVKKLDDKGKVVGDLTLDQWPVKGLADREATGLTSCSIIFIANGIKPQSDYSDGLIALQDELNAKQTQIARVLAKHSDPKIQAPQEAVDDQGNLRVTHDVVFRRTKDDSWEYLVWDAQLAAALDDRKFTLNALCMTAEMSPVLLGIKEGAAPDAARKLRLEATNSLAKARRKAATWKAAVKRIANLLAESITSTTAAYASTESAAVEMRDGIPIDEKDEAETIAVLRAAKVMSRERAVEKQLVDPAAVAKELKLLDEEDAKATPSIFMSSPSSAGNAGVEGASAAKNGTEGDEEYNKPLVPSVGALVGQQDL